jgi:hypothetical protein
VWRQETARLERTNRVRSPIVQQQFHDSAGDQLNEARSAVIEDHREQQQQLKNNSKNKRKHCSLYKQGRTIERVKELHENFKRETHRSGQDSAEISADRAKSIRTNYLSRFFTDYSRQLESTVTDTFKRFSAEFTDRDASESTDSEYLPKLVQSEIDNRLKPMTDQIIKRMTQSSNINKN